jgi:hypothetical protein
LHPKRHDSVKRIIPGIGRNSSAETVMPRCDGMDVAFLPQGVRFSADFWANLPLFVESMPRWRRPAASVGVD